VDRLAILEQRMNALLSRLEECKAAVTRLTQENTKIRGQTGDAEALRKENRQLSARINQLERELKMQSGRSADMKARLKGAIERIDSIEKDIAQL
jgi:predicted RNase H-like nuclease (RuvC/YqgF family)